MAGPSPTTPLSATRERVLRTVAEADGRQLTLAEIHGNNPQHPNSTRQILGHLVADGLLATGAAPRTGPGRPALTWSVTPTGRGALSATDEAATVVGVLASYVVESTDGPSAHDVGIRWSRAHSDLVDRSGHGVAGLVEVLAALGFDPVHRRDESGESLLLRACPLIGAARDNREVVCEMHRGMLDGVVHRIGDGQGVTLQPFAEDGGCCVEVDD